MVYLYVVFDFLISWTNSTNLIYVWFIFNLCFWAVSFSELVSGMFVFVNFPPDAGRG